MYKIILCFLFFLQLNLAFGQDYIAVKGGDNLTVTVLKTDSVKIYFKQFETGDTTQYFLQKDNTLAIGFASKMLKRIKDLQFKNERSYKSAGKTISPDYIYPTGGEVIKAIIDKISDDQIQFHLAFENDTNTYFLKKSEIDEITFKEISITQNKEDNLSDYELIAKARTDAYQNYDGYKPAAVGSFVAGVFVWFYFVPILVPVIVSSTPPREENLGNTNIKLMQKPIYANSYISTSKSIKSNKAWSNFGYGALTSLGTGVLFVVYILSTLR